MRELDFRMLEMMGLQVSRVTRAYGAYICDTQNGIKILKESQCPLTDIWFAYRVKEYLCEQGYDATDRYCVTEEGLPYIQDAMTVYTVRNWMRGEETDLTDVKDMIRVMEDAARMHLLGRGMEEPQECAGKLRWYELSERYIKQNRMLRGYIKNLRYQGRYTDFDLLFMKVYRYYEEQAVQAAEMMKDTICMQEADRARLERSFIHGDFCDHASITDHRSTLLCNFEKSCYGMQVQDLITLFEKTMRKWNWDFERFLRMLEAYQRVRSLKKSEIRILYAGMLFPERFSRMCQDAYGTKRKWISQSNWSKLNEIREMQGKREEFLLQFRRYFQI